MKKKIFLALSILIFVPSPSFAQIYKCSVSGKTIFQSAPCPTVANNIKQNNGFGFDGWNFGMDLRTVKQQARKRQLAMSPGSSNFLSSYNEKIINSQPNKRSYTYKTKILDKLTSVTLFFTKTTQELYQINVTFYVVQLKPEERKYFYESLYSSLSEKYGKPEKIKKDSSGNLLADFVLKDMPFVNSHIIWKPTKTDSVILDYNKHYQNKSSYKLSYLNLPLVQQNKKEITYELRQRTNKAIAKDANKL